MPELSVSSVGRICGTLFSLLVMSAVFFPQQIWAENMTSQNFQIQQGNLNMTSGNKSSMNFKLSDVVGQTSAGLFNSKGYVVKAGFLNILAGDFFSFSVSPAVADFGDLAPNFPVERPLQLTVKNGNSPGYTVDVIANTPLSTGMDAVIADTSCNKEYGCTVKNARQWTKNTAYGFGYRMTGKAVPKDFTQDNFYRPFPNLKNNDEAAVVMQSAAKKVTDISEMRLKANIGPDQPVGQYRNTLIFTAVAGI